MRASFAVFAGLVAVAVANKPTYVKTETVDVTVTSCAETKTDCVYQPTASYWGDVPAPSEDASKTWGDADVPSSKVTDPSKTWGDADVPSSETDAPKTWIDAEVPSSAVVTNTWVDADVPAGETPAPATWADADAPSTLVNVPTGDKVADGTAPTPADYKPSEGSDVADYTGAASSTAASLVFAGFAAVAAMIVV